MRVHSKGEKRKKKEKKEGNSRGSERKNVQAISCSYCIVSFQSILKTHLFSSSISKVLSPEKTLNITFTFSFVSSTSLCPSGDLLSNRSYNSISTFLAQRSVYTGSWSQQALVAVSSLKWLGKA